ncbi:uncharacterized protein TNCV_3636721 [Trichonephila clavipes]|nr:uncharacterized protein TNCV_3636721 [Trichonephila clavipes]
MNSENCNKEKLFYQGSRLKIYLSNVRTWLLDHLTLSLPLPTDDVISRVFFESSALEQVVAIHSGIGAEREGFVSSQAKPVEVYSQKVYLHWLGLAACLKRKLDNLAGSKREKLFSVKVLDESRSFFRVHTSYFSNIPKCIKAEFIASWACSQSSVVSSSSVRINLIVCLIELCTSFELRDKFGGGAGYNYVKRG